MQIVEMASSVMLAGHVATPLSVSGVTTVPSTMPMATKHSRARPNGTFMGRPNSAATATASTEPETSPAGNPTTVKATPPASAISSVSQVSSNVRIGGMAGSIEVDQCRLRPAPSNDSSGPHAEEPPKAAFRSMAAPACFETRSFAALLSMRPKQYSMPARAAQHDAHEIGGVPGAELLHDSRAMDFDSARADAELASGLLVGEALCDALQHFVFARRKLSVAGELAPQRIAV